MTISPEDLPAKVPTEQERQQQQQTSKQVVEEYITALEDGEVYPLDNVYTSMMNWARKNKSVLTEEGLAEPPHIDMQTLINVLMENGHQIVYLRNTNEEYVAVGGII